MENQIVTYRPKERAEKLQKRKGIEYITMKGLHKWEAAKDVRIPLRNRGMCVHKIDVKGTEK